ncbi:ABC transporter ATP-binding protein [Paradesulfitobacterium ferrireducens]|uniref:ABC transporter ATP-binding protein n=1 Tax=Paradesulfitobacterium ferrireducens TaxID=2816476 RepID=UPI001A8C9C5B|nr:ABC transporter ATP-binding protein [Paradesulfitobacterium ferrireducens]
MIQTRHLSKTYANGFTAVQDLNLKIEKGDIFGFLGPNGAGKTTTIRMLTGLLKPSHGEITIGGLDMARQSTEIKKVIGVLPESHGYYAWMTGREYLKYFAQLYGQDMKDMRTYIPYLLEKVGLGSRNKPIGQYSRGMRQRLGIAKTLIHHPQIIFLDEPTLGLDPVGQKDIQKLLLDLNRSLEVTVFITSHLLKDIEVLCNKVAIVRNGKLIEQGEIRSLQTKYGEQNLMRLKTSDPAKTSEIIKLIASVDVTEDGQALLIRMNESEPGKQRVKGQILKLLLAENVDIYEFSKVEPTMEEVFFRLVSGEGGNQI